MIRSEPLKDCERDFYQQDRKDGKGRREDEILLGQAELLDVSVGELVDNSDEREKYEEEEEQMAGDRRPFLLQTAQARQLPFFLRPYSLAFPDNYLALLDAHIRAGHPVVGRRMDIPGRDISDLVLSGLKRKPYVDENSQDEGKKDDNKVFSQGETRGRVILFALHFFAPSAIAFFSYALMIFCTRGCLTTSFSVK